MYIPEESIYFRLVGHNDGYYMYSRSSKDPECWHYKGPQYEDQLFSLIHGDKHGHAGHYAIKGKVSGKVLFSRTHKKPYVDHVGGDGEYNDNWFKFEPGTGEYKHAFRIFCPDSNTVVYSRPSPDPAFGNYKYPDNVYGDQFWNFIFEDMTVDRVEFNLGAGQILNKVAEVVAEQTLTNNTGVEQEMSFNFTSAIAETSKFEYSAGFELTVGTEISAGIPFVGDGKISAEASTTHTWTFGKENTFTKSYSANFPVTAGPRKSVRAVASVWQGRLKVPYTIHLSSKTNKARTTTTGTWEGVATWDLKYTVNPA